VQWIAVLGALLLLLLPGPASGQNLDDLVGWWARWQNGSGGAVLEIVEFRSDLRYTSGFCMTRVNKRCYGRAIAQAEGRYDLQGERLALYQGLAYLGDRSSPPGAYRWSLRAPSGGRFLTIEGSGGGVFPEISWNPGWKKGSAAPAAEFPESNEPPATRLPGRGEATQADRERFLVPPPSGRVAACCITLGRGENWSGCRLRTGREYQLERQCSCSVGEEPGFIGYCPD
jgi:hypothetical protein